MNQYPENTRVAVGWREIYQKDEDPSLYDRASTRMVKIASHLPRDEYIGWQMTVPSEGLVRFSTFGTETVQMSDLEWVSEETAKTEVCLNETVKISEEPDPSGWQLYEIYLPATQGSHKNRIGFGGECDERYDASGIKQGIIPVGFSRQFGDLIRALRINSAVLRYVAGSATPVEQKRCEQAVVVSLRAGLDAGDYIGLPVRTKVLLKMPGQPPVRLRSMLDELIPGADLRLIGSMTDEACVRQWNHPLNEPRIVPDIAARILALEPIVGTAPIIGIKSCCKAAPPIPAGHSDPIGVNAITLGTAVDTSGAMRDIKMVDQDLRRHIQIIGQTGTGKSTLIANALVEAIKSGHGVTFFDPHGTTIEVILNAIPAQYTKKIRVVHIGDELNPVPINMWNGNRACDNEKLISDMCLLFEEIFDPKKEGIVGPRWQRWFSVFASAAITLFGKRASFDSIMVLSQNRDNMVRLCQAIKRRNPSLTSVIENEYAINESREFSELLNWTVSKLQRLTSIAQLRNTLGAGANALDFNRTMDTDTVTLIDLASPKIGTNAARMIGTMILLQLWNAATAQTNRERTHVVAIDEAHLFQTNPLSQMLAEGRKFGIALMLAHQHSSQLNSEIRDALDANSASFVGFRLSVKDAAMTINRFEDDSVGRALCRLNAFNAITTLSINGKQTDAFTLMVHRPKIQKASAKTISEIERQSIDTLVTPFRYYRALKQDEIQRALEMASTNTLPPYTEYTDEDNDQIDRILARIIK